MIYFSLVFAVAPFVMALIRPNQSGDLRMLWMVLAAFTATVVVVATAKSQKSAGNTIVPIVAFTLATFAATITRMAFGGRPGAGLLAVGAAFGFSFAISAAHCQRKSS